MVKFSESFENSYVANKVNQQYTEDTDPAMIQKRKEVMYLGWCMAMQYVAKRNYGV